MIANVENVVKWLQLNKLDEFKVSLTDKENQYVFISDAEQTFETNLMNFRNVMDISTGGRYYIRARSEKDKSNRAWHTEWFANQADKAATITGTPAGVPAVGYVAIDELERRLEEERKSIKTEIELDRLKAENAELKTEIREKDNITMTFMEKLNPYIGTIAGSVVSKLMPAQPTIGVAGMEKPAYDDFEPVDAPATDNDNARLAAALKRWSEAEPDFIEIIETLAEMAEAQDSKYLMAKGMLIKEKE